MTKTICVLMCALLIPVAVVAQPHFDGWSYSHYPEQDGYQIYFDDSVFTDYGGTLMDPVWYSEQSVPVFSAYLVLSDPSMGTNYEWEAAVSLVGNHIVLDYVEYPVPTISGTSEDWAVHTHYVLAEWSLYNLSADQILFYVYPDPATENEAPGYYGETETFIPMTHPISDYNGYDKQIMILNGGVTPTVASSLDRVKALYR